MYNLLLVVRFADTLDAAARDAAMGLLKDASAALPGVRRALCAPTLPQVYNGGDLLLRLSFEDRRACHAALAAPVWREAAKLLADPARVAGLEHVEYGAGLSGGAADAPGVYRVALFAATRAATPERLAAFGADTVAMPSAIAAIQSWRLAEAQEVAGARPWTHVWEQEYRDLQGLQGAYMRHPAHWARVERWFDPEQPEHLVDPWLVHTFCALDRSVLQPQASR